MVDLTFERQLRKAYDDRHPKISINKDFWKSDADATPLREHINKYTFIGNKNTPKNPGEIFLFERLDFQEDIIIHYPQVGVYLNTLPCDQTIEIEWFNIRRTWEYHQEFSFTSDKETRTYDFYDTSSLIQSQILWHDDLLCYGVWDKLPDWKTLKKYYELTWWFNKPLDIKRDHKIDFLLK